MSKIQRVMQQNGSPPAEFKTDEERTFLTVILPLHPAAVGQTPQVTPQVNIVGKALLKFCQTQQERTSIQKHLRIRDAKHLRERYLQPLLAAGYLEMSDPAHPNSPTQKYHTTQAGIMALKGEQEAGGHEESQFVLTVQGRVRRKISYGGASIVYEPAA